MYIKKVKKRSGHSNKSYYYLHLVENIRTEAGPRQKLVLNLGNLDIDPSQYKSLAKRIKDILTGQQSFMQLDNKLETFAKQSADKIFKKQAKEINKNNETDFQNVDIDSIKSKNARTIGPEYVCHSIWNELHLTDFFLKNKVSSKIIPIIKAVIIGRLIEPASELHTYNWAAHRSAIYELVGSPLRHTLTSFYRATDRIFELKDKIEQYLAQTEKDLFSLKETYYFFDLTNTYFEGNCLGSSKAKYGRSKEKRSDCKLIALGLVIDESGFIKCSNLFDGNTNEDTTLEGMIKRLEDKTGRQTKNKTIVMDAGISCEKNIQWLKEHNYHYIVVNKKQAPVTIDYNNMEIIKEDIYKDIKIEVKRFSNDEEVYILCKSKQKQKKEESIRTRIEQLLIDKLQYYKSGLKKPRRMKNYAKVVEAIGRLKEKYTKVGKLYTIEVIPEEGKSADDPKLIAKNIKWTKKQPSHKEQIENEGSYILRTDRAELTDREIWNIYIMLRQIEYSFLCMKSYLGMRPNFHQKEERIDAHMFISVLAYHILHIVEYRLRQHEDMRKWDTIRDELKTHQRLTISFQKKDENARICYQQIRMDTELEPEHKDIYKKLNLTGKPLSRKNTVEQV